MKEKEQIKETELLTFLRRVKDGEFAPIEKSSLPFSRMGEDTEFIKVCEETYYYGIS